jgi:hypothetical protein
MLVKTKAIVLHSFKLGESRMIVDMFTCEAGRQSFVVPVPKTSKSKLKKQYFQPMTLLEIESDLRQRITHLILDFRMDIVSQQLDDLKRQMKEAGTDMARIKELMTAFQEAQNLRNALARQLGSDVIV